MPAATPPRPRDPPPSHPRPGDPRPRDPRPRDQRHPAIRDPKTRHQKAAGVREGESGQHRSPRRGSPRRGRPSSRAAIGRSPGMPFPRPVRINTEQQKEHKSFQNVFSIPCRDLKTPIFKNTSFNSLVNIRVPQSFSHPRPPTSKLARILSTVLIWKKWCF